MPKKHKYLYHSDTEECSIVKYRVKAEIDAGSILVGVDFHSEDEIVPRNALDTDYHDSWEAAHARLLKYVCERVGELRRLGYHLNTVLASPPLYTACISRKINATAIEYTPSRQFYKVRGLDWTEHNRINIEVYDVVLQTQHQLLTKNGELISMAGHIMTEWEDAKKEALRWAQLHLEAEERDLNRVRDMKNPKGKSNARV
jgi:hypothetical protein